MEPLPGRRIDRLAGGGEHTQFVTATALAAVIAAGHQGSDRGGGGIENFHIVAVDDIAHPLIVRVVGHPFKHDAGGTVGQRTVDQIGVPGDPAHIGRAPVHLAGLVIECQLMSQ